MHRYKLCVRLQLERRWQDQNTKELCKKGILYVIWGEQGKDYSNHFPKGFTTLSVAETSHTEALNALVSTLPLLR